MKMKEWAILAAAAVAVVLALRASQAKAAAPQYWATAQGNTGYPAEAKTGSTWI